MPPTRASKLGCSAVLTAVCWISGPAQAALVTNLSNHWKLDDTSGSTAVAATGGVNGTIQSFPPSKLVTIDQPGQVNKAFVFSGGTFGGGAETNPGVLLDAGMLPATGQFTVSAWIKTSGAGTSGNGSIFANRTGFVNNSFGLDINEQGQLRVLAGSAVPAHLTSPAAVNTGDWVHVAASRNGSNLVGLYVNGQVVNTVTGTESIDQVNPFSIGNRNGGLTPFTGSIDDVATWTRALTGQELALLGGLGYFAGVGVSDGTQIDNLLGVYNAQTGTATVGGQTWTYASGLGSTTVGARGGSVEQEDAFIVLGSDGTGVAIVPEPGAIMLAGLGRPRRPFPTLAAEPRLGQAIPAYRCPDDVTPPANAAFGGYGTTNYLYSDAIGNTFDAHKNTIGPNAVTPAHIRDGQSNTILYGERAQRPPPARAVAGVWAGRPANTTNASTSGRGAWPPGTVSLFPDSSDPACTRHAWSSNHPGGIQVVFCDTAIRFLSNDIDSHTSYATCLDTEPRTVTANRVYQNLFRRDDGNPIGEF